MSLKIRYLLERTLNVARLAGEVEEQFCLDLSSWTIAMQVLFVLRFYYPYKTDEIDRLPWLESRDGREDE